MIKETTQKHCDSNSCCGIRRVTFHASLTQESQGLETALDMLRGPGCSPHGLGAVVSSKSWPNTIKAELAVEALRSQPGALTRLPASRDSCHAQVCIALSTRDGNGDFHLTHPNMEAQLIKGSQIERRSKSHQSLAPRGLNWSWLVKKRLKWSSVILPGRTWSSKQKEFPFWERELVVCLPTSQDFFFFLLEAKVTWGALGPLPSSLSCFLGSGWNSIYHHRLMFVLLPKIMTLQLSWGHSHHRTTVSFPETDRGLPPGAPWIFALMKGVCALLFKNG